MDIQSISSDDDETEEDFDDDRLEDDDGDYVEDDDSDYVDDDDDSYVKDNAGDNVEDNACDTVEDNDGDYAEDNGGDYVDDGHEEFVDDDGDYLDDANEYLEEPVQIETNGTAASSNAVTEEILGQFKKWLQGIDGGRREEKTAKQYTSQIFAIIQAIDPKNLTVASTLSVKALRDKWLTPLEKQRRPGTCKAYLGSLSKFIRFLMVENPSNILKSQEDARKVKEQVLEWMSSYNAPIAQRRWEKQLEDLEKLVTPKDIQEFDKSGLARSAITTLGQCMGISRENIQPTQAEYCLVRDYLLTTICINNACRSGPLSSMTLGELRKAKNEGNQLVVDVLKHKTMKYHGPATVVLSSSIHKWLLAFVSFMRHRLTGVTRENEDRVFVSWSAKAMTSSMVTAQINSFWQRSTGKADRVSATSFRKAAVSAVHSDHAHLKNDLADLMSHNPKTAEKFYLIRQKRKNAAKTSESLQNIFRGSPSPSKDDTENDKTPEEQPGQSESQGQGSSSRHVWSREEDEAIRECFKTNIGRKNITIEETRLKIKDHPVLKDIMVTKVRDKVRSLFGTGTDDQSIQLPTEEETVDQKVEKWTQKEDDAEKTISLFTASSRRGGAFSDEQTNALVSLFEDLVRTTAVIDRKSVMKRLGENLVAKAALDGFTPLQICDKIRTERRRFRKLSTK